MLSLVILLSLLISSLAEDYPFYNLTKIGEECQQFQLNDTVKGIAHNFGLSPGECKTAGYTSFFFQGKNKNIVCGNENHNGLAKRLMYLDRTNNFPFFFFSTPKNV